VSGRITVWVLGDQLNRHVGALRDAHPSTHHVLVIESLAKLRSQRWHRQRAHLLLASMRRFSSELREEGFEVDHRVAPSFASGLAGHRRDHEPSAVVAAEPLSYDGLEMLRRLDVEVVRNDHFVCHYEDFVAWAKDRKRLKMEDFYRWQRQRTGVLLEPDGEPCGGQWNYDHDNREPPPKDGSSPWAAPLISELDDVDAQVLRDLDEWGIQTWGDDPSGLWATSRAEAMRRLDHFVASVLPMFGPHEDAMLTDNWHLAHSTLSPYMNIGLLTPTEVVAAVEDAYRSGGVPIASAEGFIRQVMGWREYVWGVFWLWMPEYRNENALDAHEPLPPVFHGDAPTRMRCVATAIEGLERRAYTHHIQRLMVLSNLALTAGVDPWAMTEWMWSTYIDGAEWVMLPNVIGMSLHADGGKMATKPYASGGAYIDKMSDHCKGCHYDRKARVGERACPFTTLYWDFIARHRERFIRNPRVAQQVRAAERLGDLDAVRSRADEVRAMLRSGTL
jgi:deoxyribodipyrimidine photolyase-related protein